MAKLLNTDDLLEAVKTGNIPDCETLCQTIEEAVDMLADKVATHYDIVKGETSDEGKAFGGLCTSFYAKTPDQPCPEPIEDGDPSGDWETKKQAEDASGEK